MSRDIRIIYDVTENAKILATTNTAYRLSCVLVTLSALCTTSNVASFTADCNTITLVYQLVSNVQDDGRKPEV